jgi:hypothetical protein
MYVCMHVCMYVGMHVSMNIFFDLSSLTDLVTKLHVALARLPHHLPAGICHRRIASMYNWNDVATRTVVVYNEAAKVAACIPTCIHTYIHSFIHSFMHSYARTFIRAYLHSNINECL